MKVVASRRLPGPAFDELDDLEIVAPSALGPGRPDVEALIVSNEAVPLDRLPRLRLVANFGAGIDQIDVARCTERGVVVTNTPGVLDSATADLTFGLILAVRRRLVEGDRAIRAGQWVGPWARTHIAEQVSGATLGILGLGRIGLAVARRAQGFDLRVIYHQRRAVGTELAHYVELDALFARSDIVSIHCPLTSQTRGLVDRRLLALMRAGTCLVNAARGGIVDEPALVAELVSGRLRAGLDVFALEPRVPKELLGLPNVVLTPHLGSATRQTREAMTRVVVDNVLAVAAGRPPITPVHG